MAAPLTIKLQNPPTKLDDYKLHAPHDQQPSHISQVFCDAMEVRRAVFVQEQGVPAENDVDEDDARSFHWVAYMYSASVDEISEPGTSLTQPIGTLRMIPFPHLPHPVNGGRYEGSVLQETQGPSLAAESKTVYGEDRATELHDGKEPYVKIGRLAIVREFRGRGIASQLWRAAREWLEENPGAITATELGNMPSWNGLVCCHAAEDAVRVYEGWGFQVDKGMGRWFEDNIPCVGMFIRLTINLETPQKE